MKMSRYGKAHGEATLLEHAVFLQNLGSRIGVFSDSSFVLG
jgi:hypothetical protein